MKTYNIYIDETCHLEYDKIPVMCIGYIMIDKDQQEQLSKQIKTIKLKHRSPTELKWNKLSISRLNLYKELVDLFFDSSMQFRVILIKNKDKIDNQTYNEDDQKVFYYKSAFYLLRNNIKANEERRVYFDINEKYSSHRLKKISTILEKVCGKGKFTHFQNIKSDESEFIQLADFFIGAVAYSNRNDIINSSKVKLQIIEYIEEKSRYSLKIGTPPWATKFNIFDFQLRS